MGSEKHIEENVFTRWLSFHTEFSPKRAFLAWNFQVHLDGYVTFQIEQTRKCLAGVVVHLPLHSAVYEWMFRRMVELTKEMLA